MKTMIQAINGHAPNTPDRQAEQGVVSIFIVIFFALLLSIITISFIQIVIRDSDQSTNNDLSQSAYDSAEAGIEDGKRAIALYTNACNSGNATACNAYAVRLNSQACDTLAASTFANDSALKLRSNGSSVSVQSSASDVLDQAYTCEKISLNTPDYVNSEQSYHSDVIPLKSTADFSAITLNWFTHADAGLADSASFKPRTSPASTLPTESNWGSATPSILRVELIGYDGTTITNTSLQANSRTLFLYPSASGGTTTSFDVNAVHQSSTAPAPIVPIKCAGTATVQYACSASVSLGNLDTSAGTSLFLRVTPIYSAQTTFQAQLTNGASAVDFDGVQPMIDSTGRANDLYRRVQARVRLQNLVSYPEYSVDVNQSFCKNFSVGATAGDYSSGSCN